MEVETLGVARSLGWKVHMRCANGYREGTRSMRRCVYRKQRTLRRWFARAGRTSRLPKSSGVAAEAIVEKAKQQVPLPNLPPKPAGKTVVEQQPVTQTIQVGAPTWASPLRMITRQITVNTPKTRLVDASPEEIAAWDAEVKKLQDGYNAKLSAKITELSHEQELENAKAVAQAVKEISTDVIVPPVILAAAGVIGAVDSLKAAFKKSPKDNS